MVDVLEAVSMSHSGDSCVYQGRAQTIHNPEKGKSQKSQFTFTTIGKNEQVYSFSEEISCNPK
jgi:hypothetical protein